MSHRVAELITEAEAGDEEDKRRATDLIFRLWDNRARWSEGWPPPATEAMREYLASEHRRDLPHQSSVQNLANLIDVLRELEALHINERELLRSLALTETTMGEEIAQALEEEDDLEREQALLLRSLERDREEALEHFGAEGDPKAKRESRLNQYREELKALGRKRAALTKQVASLYESADFKEE